MSEYERLSADWERLKAKEEAVIREAHIRAIRDLEAKLAALESRLAEVAPVVEAAEALEPLIQTMSVYMDGTEACVVGQKGAKPLAVLRSAVRAMHAARSLRGAGEGGGA